ncbi:MAG: 30S ribosomal protein S5 [Spirochaetia bacterium]
MRRENRKDDEKDREFAERLVKMNRVAKVVKGGRRFSYNVLVVVGDGKGRVGYGFGKANDVSEAIRKSTDRAKRSLRVVSLKGTTLPHEVFGKFKSVKVLLKPAAPGTGIIAGGSVRAVMEAVGVRDILGKSLGARNSINMVKAVFDCFDQTLDFRTVAAGRGKSIRDLWG